VEHDVYVAHDVDLPGRIVTAPDARRVLLLCGGRSGEHEVSLASAASVLAAAPPTLELEPRVITRAGRLLDEAASAEALRAGRSDAVAAAQAAPTLIEGLAALDLTRFDAAFPLLHGPNGEDGSVQGLLRVADLPFVGSEVLGSAAAMDKIVMKRLFASAGLPQVAWREVTAPAWRVRREAVVRALAELGPERFVKPANLGSSVGISRAVDDATLAEALDLAFRYDRRVVVEAAVADRREIEVAILDGDPPTVSPPGEIVVLGDTFYDYEHKYQEGKAELRIPAPLEDATTARVRTLAAHAFELVDAAGLARVDLFVRPDGSVLLNEINTLPGFTRTSMYPRLMAAAGVAYPELIERLVDLAIARHRERAALAID
jgi:D-alanine-D-alanine ligase